MNLTFRSFINLDVVVAASERTLIAFIRFMLNCGIPIINPRAITIPLLPKE